MASQTVQDAMITDFCVVSQYVTLDRALTQLLRYPLNGAPVVTDQNQLCGFLSLKDCLPYAPLLDSRDAPCALTVAQVMTPEPHCLRPDTSLEEAYHAFLEQWFHAYPVVDEQGVVVGLLSRRQLLALVTRREDPVNDSD
jgi:CBS-domain-containing membrane protein